MVRGLTRQSKRLLLACAEYGTAARLPTSAASYSRVLSQQGASSASVLDRFQGLHTTVFYKVDDHKESPPEGKPEEGAKVVGDQLDEMDPGDTADVAPGHYRSREEGGIPQAGGMDPDQLSGGADAPPGSKQDKPLRPGEMPPDYDASAEEPEKKERPQADIPDFEDPTIQPDLEERHTKQDSANEAQEGKYWRNYPQKEDFEEEQARPGRAKVDQAGMPAERGTLDVEGGEMGEGEDATGLAQVGAEIVGPTGRLSQDTPGPVVKGGKVLESGGKGTLLNNPNAPQPEPSRDNPRASPFDQQKERDRKIAAREQDDGVTGMPMPQDSALDESMDDDANRLGKEGAVREGETPQPPGPDQTHRYR